MDKWIYEPPPDSEDEFKSNDLTFMLAGSASTNSNPFNGPSHQLGNKKGRKKRKGGKAGEADEEDEEIQKVCILKVDVA